MREGGTAIIAHLCRGSAWLLASSNAGRQGKDKRLVGDAQQNG